MIGSYEQEILRFAQDDRAFEGANRVKKGRFATLFDILITSICKSPLLHPLSTRLPCHPEQSEGSHRADTELLIQIYFKCMSVGKAF
jgi:hypothetical protein